MKKILIAALALPATCFAAGYGAGHVLGPEAGTASHAEPAGDSSVDSSEASPDAAPQTAPHEGQQAAGAPPFPEPAVSGPADAAMHAQPAPQHPAAHGDAGHDTTHAETAELHARGPAPHGTAPDPGSHTAKVTGMNPATQVPAEVVKLGRMTVPVYKSATVTYVVADFGIAFETADRAAEYRVVENATRLRDAILRSMHDAAALPVMQGASIDSEVLSSSIRTDLGRDFAGLDDVLFLSLYKMDVPRS
ncbi:hypothetical protein EKE94_16050 [Mesobaculum littorinae]|uniref:Flagellar protein FliL n=1 Tax=Mesobaculum littorinae TaxID=2486419 RepID=A0A438ADW2_9RHOB|nr:hypothetical protein [Mesobaculum littorinae]RVV96857.1 hypothetical protein EKE94_16050 [Mesobaculum littorinae]